MTERRRLNVRTAKIKCGQSELKCRGKKAPKKLLPNCRVWPGEAGSRLCAPQTNWTEGKIGEMHRRDFPFRIFFALRTRTKFSADILVFACLLVPVPIRLWVATAAAAATAIPLQFFLFGQFSLAPYKKPLKTTEFLGKEIFAPLLFECIWWLKFFGVVFFFFFTFFSSHSASSSLAKNILPIVPHTKSTIGTLGERARTGLKGF